jgi:hypothetical protein
MSLLHCHLFYSALLGLVALGSADVARAADAGGTVTVLPDNRPATGIWVAAVRLGDYLTSSLSEGKPTARPTPVPKSAVTDKSGAFTFHDLGPGQYEFSIRSDSLPPHLAPESRPVRAVLVSSRDAARVDLTVTRLAAFDGTARRLAGGALAHVRVQAFHRGDNTPFADTWTDGQGAFRIGKLDRNVPVDLFITTKEGQYRRVTKTPIKAGVQSVEVVLPPWSPATKRRVVLAVTLPSVGERHYEVDWISKPEEAEEGFRTTVSLDRDGRGELESPDGVFVVRVRETGSEERVWTAPRFYRVDLGSGPIVAKVDLSVDP